MFRFAHPEYLYLFIIVPIITGLFIYTQYLRRKKIKLFGNPELLAELMPNISYIRPHVKFYIQLLAVALIIIILAQPQFGTFNSYGFKPFAFGHNNSTCFFNFLNINIRNWQVSLID